MRIFSLCFLLGLCLIAPAKAERTKLFDAEKQLVAAGSRPISDLKSDEDKKTWTEARIAWIALERLRGRETSARRIFLGCKTICEKHGNKKDWQAVKEWAKALKN